MGVLNDGYSDGGLVSGADGAVGEGKPAEAFGFGDDQLDHDRA